MTILFLTLSCVLALGLAVFSYKYFELRCALISRCKKIVNRMYSGHQKTSIEIKQRESAISFRENQLHIEYNKLRDELMEQFNKRLESIKHEYEERAEADSKELDEAIEAQEKELMTSIKKVDDMLEEKIKSLTIDNTLFFDCVCGKQDIPCFIALNKENTFRCDQCNSVYTVSAKFSPIMIGKASSEEEFNKIIEARLQEQEENEDYNA